MKCKCAITGIVCPETNDNQKPVYCNHWVDGIAETNTDASGQVTDQIYRGCFLRRLPDYLRNIAASGSHLTASFDKAHNVLRQSEIRPEIKALIEIGIAGFVGEQISSDQQLKEIVQCVNRK